MIRPDEIRRKAENLYPKFLAAWLAGESCFPWRVPANLDLDAGDHSAARDAIESLRDGAKESRGFGYSVEWQERRSRAFGLNRFPAKIFFETQDDLLRLIGKQAEFRRFAAAVERIGAEFPDLSDWIAAHRRQFIDVASKLDGLLEVTRYFRARPRPNQFARELPLSVDTKFIEQHEAVLRQWFDLLLPPESIRADESHFARRYGLRHAEMHVLVRFLCPELQRRLGVPWSEFSLPLSALAALEVGDAEVFIVENKVNALTLPPRPRSLVLGGLGRAVTELREVGWLATTPITYWGDVEGFEILSALRACFPHARSLLMDESSLRRWRALATAGTGRVAAVPPHLVPEEESAFQSCVRDNLRIEQERIVYPVLIQRELE